MIRIQVNLTLIEPLTEVEKKHIYYKFICALPKILFIDKISNQID
jgi:hypothetical protein